MPNRAVLWSKSSKPCVSGGLTHSSLMGLTTITDIDMREEALRIFIGPARIGNKGSILASAFRDRGIRVIHVIDQIPPCRAESGMEYDILLSFRGQTLMQKWLSYLYHFARFFPRYNAFIFLFGRTLLPYNLDLPLLRLFRKKTVMWFVGSDIRHYEALARAARKVGIEHFASKDRGAGPQHLKKRLRMIRMVEKYVDYIIAGPSFSQLLTRRCVRILPPLDICNITYKNTPNSRPMVVHAPSNDAFKGTSYVIEAIEQLKSEGYDFEFHLFRGVSNARVRETLTTADIAVDQLFGLHPGVFAIEAMAAGCAVLVSSYPEFAGFPPELPVIHTDPDSIHQNLKMLLDDHQLRRELGEKGRKYVAKYHDHRDIADQLVRLLTTGVADITFDPRQGADDCQGKGNGPTERQ